MSTSLCSPDRKENAASFMLFAYFGIASSDNGTDIVTAAINRAYRDAASHVLSFAGDDKKERENAKAAARRLATEKIKNAIDKLRDCQQVDDYNKWHEDLLDSLMLAYKNENLKEGYKFTYGVAQKWVNMTMKYLYVIYYFFRMCGYKNTDFQSNYGDMIDKYTGDFHVPIDGYILTAAKDKLGVECNSKTWSGITDHAVYIKFQKEVREQLKGHCFPIDWEGPEWIKSAK